MKFFQCGQNLLERSVVSVLAFSDQGSELNDTGKYILPDPQHVLLVDPPAAVQPEGTFDGIAVGEAKLLQEDCP
jgi:hypothetical protein